MKNRPIGIFDSGVGGLTVLKEVRKILPNENIIYFGDTARVPYGNKSKATIVKFSTESILFLLRKKVKMVVVACNTASSLALDYLVDAFNVPIVGVIEAGAAGAVEASMNGNIGVIGTRSTIASGSYEKAILRNDKSARVYTSTCPLFVPLAEEGILTGRIVDEAMDMYLAGFKRCAIDTIILGCTHYPLLKDQISNYLKNTIVIDSAQAVASEVKDLLTESSFLNNSKRRGKEEFYVTDEPTGFVRLAKLFLKRTIQKPKVINV